MSRPPRRKKHPRFSLSLALCVALASSLLPASPAQALRGLPAQSVRDSAAAAPARSPSAAAAETPYRQTNLISELPGVAPVEDPALAGPWGIAAEASGPLWVANSGNGTATIYRGDVGGSPFVRNRDFPAVTVLGGPPTGVVANATGDFVVNALGASAPARILFATLSGNVAGWSPDIPDGGTAHVVAGRPERSYTGLALANNGAGNFLYAADFRGGRIDVYDGSFVHQSSGFAFVNPHLPPGYHPFNVRALGGKLYVAYARAAFSLLFAEGFVGVFDFDGNFTGPHVAHARLNAPWGLALAPADFGTFSNALLVGNTGGGGGGINAFDPSTGAFLGTLSDEGGRPVGGGVFGMTFGNGDGGGDPSTLYFTSNVRIGRRGLLSSLKPAAAPAASFVQFDAADHFATETGGHVDVSVSRTGDLSQPASVNYATFDLSATQAADYLINVGTLRFAPGETAKSVRVIFNDNYDWAAGTSRQLGLLLTNPDGAALGERSTTQVSIQDDEFDTPRPGNPIDDIGFFVRQHYVDFLLREPDAGGFNSWVNLFLGCTPNNPACDRVAISASFFRSREFQTKGSFVIRVYRAALGRDPLYGEFMGDLNRLTGATAEDAAARRAAFPADFLARPEQRDALAPLSNAQFVSRLVANTLVAFPNRDQLVADLDAGAKTRADVLREIADAPQFANHLGTFNRAFVMMQYFGYLRRNPEPGGFNAWLAYLNANPNDFRTMVNGFVNSREYRNRFVEGP